MPPKAKPKAEIVPTILVVNDGTETTETTVEFPSVLNRGDFVILSGIEFEVRKACWVVQDGKATRQAKLGVNG